MVAGSLLYVMHAQLRPSVVVRLHEELMGFIEAKTVSDVIKSGQTQRRWSFKVQFVGISAGLLGVPWTQTWLDLRKTAV